MEIKRTIFVNEKDKGKGPLFQRKRPNFIKGEVTLFQKLEQILLEKKRPFGLKA